MSRPRRDAVPKVAFAASLLLGAYLYGFASNEFDLFPKGVVEAAWGELRWVKRAFWDEEHPATARRAYERQGARLLDSAAVQPGLTLVPSVWREYGWGPGLKLIDARGRVLHEWRVEPAQIFPEEISRPLARFMDFNHPQGSYLFPNGDLLVVISDVGTARLDACSRVKWRIRGEHHHSVARASDGTFWVSGRKPERGADPITGLGSVRHDQLVHLSEDGEVLRTIAVFDIIRSNEALLRRHLRFRVPDTHLNDVEPLSPAMAEEYTLFDGGDLLVSLRDLNVVLVVDPATLEVRWWTGERFIRQHDADFAGDGWIGVFDNHRDGTDRGTRLGGSRVVAFKPGTDSTAVWLRPSDAGGLYSVIRGSWQLLPNGNLLVTESDAGRVAEVSPEGELVWEWIQEPYGADRVPRIYWAERYEIPRGEVAAWPCPPDGE